MTDWTRMVALGRAGQQRLRSGRKALTSLASAVKSGNEVQAQQAARELSAAFFSAPRPRAAPPSNTQHQAVDPMAPLREVALARALKTMSDGLPALCTAAWKKDKALLTAQLARMEGAVRLVGQLLEPPRTKKGTVKA